MKSFETLPPRDQVIPGSSSARAVETGADAGVTVRVLCSDAEIAGCADAWKKLQRHFNADWDFYWHINKIKNQSPCILELRQDGEIKTLWLGRIERGTIPVRLGYLKLGAISVGRLSIITGGMLGDDSEAACRQLLRRAAEVLSEKRLDVLSLDYVPVGHVLARLARSTPNWLCRDWGVVPSTHWSMALPASYAEFLKKRSKKHRYWLNRLPRVLEEACPGKVRIRSFMKPDEVADFCRDADTISRVTYQYRLGEAFRADEDYKTRCRLLADKGGLRGYIMYIDDQPRAYWMATACQDTVYLNLTGYYPEFKKFELGTILLMRLFEEHCGVAQKVDFGHGSALYKERFGDASFEECSLRIYRLGLRGVLANVLIGFNAKSSQAAMTLLSKLGWLQKLKTLWRNRLSREN